MPTAIAMNSAPSPVIKRRVVRRTCWTRSSSRRSIAVESRLVRAFEDPTQQAIIKNSKGALKPMAAIEASPISPSLEAYTASIHWTSERNQNERISGSERAKIPLVREGLAWGLGADGLDMGRVLTREPLRGAPSME